MAEASKDESLEERLKKLIVRIDELSQDASKKTAQKFTSTSSKFNNLMEEMSDDLRKRLENMKERKETKKKQKVRIVRDTSPPMQNRFAKIMLIQLIPRLYSIKSQKVGY